MDITDRLSSDIPFEEFSQNGFKHPHVETTSNMDDQLLPHDTSVQKPWKKKPLITRPLIALSWLEMLTHCSSVIFSIAVLVLCGRQIYFADVTEKSVNSKLNAFQFVAALHAVIVGASLSAMAIYHLKYELCVGEGLPLGYIAGPFQISSLHHLIQPKFWYACLSKSNNLRKYLFGAGLLLAFILQALIGPVSAILIVPQLEWWNVSDPFGETKSFSYLNDTYESIWPSRLTGSIVPGDCNVTAINMPEKCPFSSMATITKWSEEYVSQFTSSNVTVMTRPNMLRYIAASIFDPYGYSASSTATNHIARDMGDFWVYVERHPDRIPLRKIGHASVAMVPAQADKPIVRPLVQTQCNPPVDITDQDEYEIDFPSDRLKTSPGQIFTKDVKARINATYFQQSSPIVNYHDLTEAAGQPTLGLLAAMDFLNPQELFDGLPNNTHRIGLIACTIAAHWIPTNVSVESPTNNVIVLDNPAPREAARSSELMSQARPIDVDHSYARAVNIPVLNGGNVLQFELRPLAIDPVNFRYDGSWKAKWPYVVATLNSLQLSDALARLRYVASPLMMFCDGCAANQTKGHSLIQNTDGMNNPNSGKPTNVTAKEFIANIKAHPELYTPVEWRVQRLGYGWGLLRVTEWLAAAVVFVHAILVFAHIAVVMMRRWYCEAFDSVPEFMALANRSPDLKIFQQLGVEVINQKAYSRSIQICALDRNDGRSSAVLVDNGVSRDSRMSKLRPGDIYD